MRYDPRGPAVGSLLVLLFAACATLFPEPIVPRAAGPDAGPDVGSADGPGLPDGVTAADLPADAPPEEGSDAVLPPDPGPELPEDAAPDAPVPDLLPLDGLPNTCEGVLAAIAALKPAIQGCGPGQGCTTFEFPICGSIGCFGFPMSEKPDQGVLSQIGDLAVQGQKLGCPSFHCGCDVGPPSLCMSGKCRQCPPDCTGTCDELKAAIIAAEKGLGGCSHDADCQLMDSPVCWHPLASCWVVHGSWGKKDHIKALLESWTASGCPVPDCDCGGPPKLACLAGKCSVVP